MLNLPKLLKNLKSFKLILMIKKKNLNNWNSLYLKKHKKKIIITKNMNK